MAGHDVRLFFPAYDTIDWRDHESGPVEFLRAIPLPFGSRTVEFTARYVQGPTVPRHVYAIDIPELFHRGAVYTDHIDEPLRFAALSRAAIESCQRMGWGPDVFHCNDWHTALLPVFLGSQYGWDELFRSSRHLLTVHNIGYQGLFGASVLSQVGLEGSSSWFPAEDLEADRVNFLKTGLWHADWISTVSPTHAHEIQTSDYGMGLDSVLRQRSQRLVGILNGVDYAEWDPSVDRYLTHRYSREDLRGKVYNKRQLLPELGLSPRAGTPLLGLVSRLVPQKGIDLLPGALSHLLEHRDLQFVALGSGEPRYEEFLAALQRRYPDRVVFYRGYNEPLSHRIEAASDLFVMPSLYEPCGLNQMYSLRYGAVPVVRRTGGLADSVAPFDRETDSGTGFVFERVAPDALQAALEEALELFRDRKRWLRLVRRGMARDFSWEHQVQQYVDLYRRMAE